MESRILNIFLGFLVVFTAGTGVVSAQERIGDLIEPEIERREFKEANIDTENFEIRANAGYLSIEDFGVNGLLSLSLAYHVNQDFFVQLNYGESKAGKTSYEVLTGGAPLLTAEEREYSYYRINLGYNLLPGEAFFSEQRTFNTSLYLSFGIGTTTFAGEERFTLNYGVGYRFLLNDAVALYTDFSNSEMDVDLFGVNRKTNNLEFTVGLGWYF